MSPLSNLLILFTHPVRPEISTQSNIDPGTAVRLWNKHIIPMKAKGAVLISPATTSDPKGKQWMQEFYSICGGNKCNVSI
jgi:Glycosyl hydrolase catalytic core